MTLQTRSQKFSKKTHQQFIDLKNNSNVDVRRYGVLCHQIPVMVLHNGLLQAMGYLKGKGSSSDRPDNTASNTLKPEMVLLQHFAEQFGLSSADEFLIQLQQSSITQYQFYTRQLLEMAVWYKRFAESMLKVESGGDDA